MESGIEDDEVLTRLRLKLWMMAFVKPRGKAKGISGQVLLTSSHYPHFECMLEHLLPRIPGSAHKMPWSRAQVFVPTPAQAPKGA